MIARDQPTCFPEHVLAVVSSRDDGTMLDRTNGESHESHILARRDSFCRGQGVGYTDVAYQRITYGDDRSYDNIVDVDKNDATFFRQDVDADALFTSAKGLGLFLPIADCVGTIVYDPSKQYLALAHIGRHSTVANLASKLVDYFVARGSNASDLLVWMAPHAKKESYRLEYFEYQADSAWRPYVNQTADGIYIDMAGYNLDQFLQRGVKRGNVAVSGVDTARDQNYFSHSQGDAYGRFAVLAMMR